MKIIGSLSKDDGDGNESGKKAIGLVSKTTALLVQHAFFFCIFLCRPCTTHDVKLPNLTFYGGREHTTTTLFFFS